MCNVNALLTLAIVDNVMCLFAGIVSWHTIDLHSDVRVHNGGLFVLIDLRQLLG